jgi:drug/metabolite transporter (DMT)-like permease
LTKKRRAFGYTLIIISAVLWGFLPLFTKNLIALGNSSLTVSAGRCLISGFFCLLMLLGTGEYRKVRGKDLPFYAVYGIAALAGTVIFYTMAMQQLSSAMASVLLYTAPTFVILLNRLIYRIPLTRAKLMSLAVTFAGCALVVRVYDPGAFRADFLGILFGLASGTCYSLTTVMGIAARGKYNGRINGWLMMIFGGLIFLPLKPMWQLPALSFPAVGNFLGLALVGSVIPYTLYLIGMGCQVDGGAASIISTLEVVVATLVGIFCFGDRLEWQQIVGIAVVLIGIVILQLDREK